ncbi:hypothetical protein GCM10009547_17130 [Sporichthya brevicatena]|uniref:Gram-positive cocci surface proteins LPxTG domain-containing protein n=1 Tax=Sporichthya brevicatena TaxID=171442 RepID=A0ABP3RRI9_9ACTN
MRTAALALGAGAVVLGGAGAANAAPGDAFTISGTLDSTLYPGGSGALDLSLTNVGTTELTVGEITVRVAGVTTRSAAPCLTSDFVVDQQLDPTREFTLPAGATRTLTELGIAPADLPRVSMTNTAVNQDGCKNSTVNLAFAGRAAEVGGVSVPPNPTPTPPAETPVATPAPDDDQVVGGVNLPGTGGDPMTFWTALAGLGLVALGGGSVVLTRRTKGAVR